MTGRKSEGRECIAGGKKVMKKPKYSICCKITALLLFMVLSAMMLTGGVSFAGLYSMKNISEKSSKELGETAASDAEEALEEMAGEQLLSIATEKAAYIEEKFKSVIACVDGIAQEAEDNGEKMNVKPVTLAINEVADGQISVAASDVVIENVE